MTTLVSQGGLRAVPSGRRVGQLELGYPTSSNIGTTSVPMLFGNRSFTYEQLVRSQPWVSAGIRKLVMSTMRVPLKAYSGEESDDRQRLRGHDLPRLISKPYPRARRQHMMFRAAWDVYVNGEMLLYQVRKRRGQPPSELWNIPMRYVETLYDSIGVIAFRVHLNGKSFTLAPEDVIHHDIGGSLLEPLRRTLALEDAMMEWQGQAFANGVTPRGTFVLPLDYSPQKGDLEGLRAELAKLYAGPDNGGHFGLLYGGMKWEAMGQSAADAEVINLKKLAREEVAGALDVPPPFLGILDKATYNNIAELRRAFYVDSLGTHLDFLQATIQAQLVDPVPVWDGAFLEFDLGVLLKPDNETRARMHLMMQQATVNTANERRHYEGLPAIGDADDPENPANQLFFPTNMSPDPAATAAAGDNPTLSAALTQAILLEGAEKLQRQRVAVTEEE